MFDVVDGFEPADGEEVEGCVGGMFESGLREVGIVVDVRVDAAAAIEKFRGVARNGVRGTGMRGDWPVLRRHCTPMEAWTDTASSNSWESM